MSKSIPPKSTADTFNPSSSRERRAMQAWVILCGNAMRGQIITYDDLALLMFGKPAQGVLNQILGCIAFWCIDHHLPILTVNVVNSVTGEPGMGIPLGTPSAEERMLVYQVNWYDILPPTTADFEKAWGNHT